GDGKAVSRNEEAGALPGHGATATRSAPHAGWQTIRAAEAAEEALHRRSRLERRVFAVVAVIVLGDLLVDIDLHRNHRRFHALNNVGKADRLRDLADFVVDLRVRAGAEDIAWTGRGSKAINGDAKAGHDGRHQREF